MSASSTDGVASVTGEGRVGATLTCAAPPFSGAPTEVLYRWTSYRFQRGNRVRQQSASPAYVVRPEDADRLVFCTAVAWTAGGVAESRPSPGLRVGA